MTPTHVARTGYEPDQSNLTKARAWIAGELDRHARVSARVSGDAELIISELMTNAIKAGATRLAVELRVHAGRVEVSVEDDARGELVMRTPNPSAPGGRGLPIVAAISIDWGVEPRSIGKRVWAALPAETG